MPTVEIRPRRNTYVVTSTDDYIRGPVRLIGAEAINGATEALCSLKFAWGTESFEYYRGTPASNTTTNLFTFPRSVSFGDLSVATIGTDTVVLLHTDGHDEPPA